MVLFGGKSQNGSLNNDLWLYNITLNKWTELSLDVAMKPPPVAEHTATVVDDKLYIFGGKFIKTCETGTSPLEPMTAIHIYIIPNVSVHLCTVFESANHAESDL